MPNAVDAATALLERYRDASRKQRGNLRFDVLHEVAGPNRFAIVEAWTDEAALDGHDKAASTSQFRDQLKAIQSAPYDERVARALYSGRGKSGTRADTIYVLTHVDVTPDHKEDGLALLKAMSMFGGRRFRPPRRSKFGNSCQLDVCAGRCAPQIFMSGTFAGERAGVAIESDMIRACCPWRARLSQEGQSG